MKRANPNNILIVNVHSTLNAGDAALLWLNIRQLKEAFPEASFRALVNYPDEPFDSLDPELDVMASPFAIAKAGSSRFGLLRVINIILGCFIAMVGLLLPVKLLEKLKFPWFRFAKAYRDTEIVAAVSGAQMVSFGRFSWPLIVSSIPILFTHLSRKPLYIMPQSIGPFRWGWEQWLVKLLYSRARLVFMRDDVSMKLSKKIGITEKKVSFASDPGFALPSLSGADALRIMSAYGYFSKQPSIGITVIRKMSTMFDQGRFDKYYEIVATTLANFAQANKIKVYIFNQVTGPTQMEDDRLAAKLLLNKIGKNQDWFIHVDTRLTPMELKACYGLMDMFIASRLHSGIFALGSGVPTLFIGYNPKSKGVLDAAGLGQWLIDLDEIEATKFTDLLNNMWVNRSRITEVINPSIKKCQLDFTNVSKLIAEDYLRA